MKDLKLNRKIKPIATIITDTHISDKNCDLVYDVFVKQLMPYCDEQNISVIVHCGDWFTSRTGQSIKVLRKTKEIFSKLAEYNLDMYIIPGNHDKADLDSQESFLDVFDGMMPNLKVIRDLKMIFHPTEKNFSFHFIPYFKENESYPERLKYAAESINKVADFNFLFTHIAVSGVRNNDGSEVENDLNPNLFKNFDKVFVGHYHNKSQVGSNIFYIGSGYQANFGEDAEKGFTVLYDDGTHELAHTKFPIFEKYSIKAKDLTPKEMAMAIEEFQKTGNRIKLVIEGSEEEVKSIDVKTLQDAGIIVDRKFEEIQVPQEQDIQVDKFDASNISGAYKEFCKSKGIKSSTGLAYLKEL